MLVPVDCRLIEAGPLSLPFLLTPRLALRPMIAADVEEIAAQPSEVSPTSLLAAAPGRSELETLRGVFSEEWSATGMGYLMMFEAESRFLAGHVRLKEFERPSGGRAAELTYAVDPPFQRRGYAVEAAAAALLFAFEIARVGHVLACIEPANDASLKVARRLGFIATAEGMIHGRRMRRFLMSQMAWRGQPSAIQVSRES